MDIFLHLLHPSDVSNLLEFEVENREWFEQFVPAREDRFYSNAGVAEQVISFLKEYDNGDMIPMLIKDANGTICGRINVRDIDQNTESGELGYRVGHAFGSKGIASNAVLTYLTLLGVLDKLPLVFNTILIPPTRNNNHLIKWRCYS